jgi:flagellar biosynthesis/type III secretory pathway M-ring protein FliF/YscJ
MQRIVKVDRHFTGYVVVNNSDSDEHAERIVDQTSDAELITLGALVRDTYGNSQKAIRTVEVHVPAFDELVR